MPLTTVVDYLNDRLHQLHPTARLREQAGFRYRQGQLSALPEQHGQVFQELLHRLGLEPSQVVLRLNGRALQQDPHVQAAARSFARHGYRLLATRPALDDTDWTGLHELGVGWVVTNLPPYIWRHDQDALLDWSRQAQAHSIGLWIDRIETPEALERAQALGAELVEGELFRAVADLRVREAS